MRHSIHRSAAAWAAALILLALSPAVSPLPGAPRAGAAPAVAVPPGLDAAVARIMKAFEVPGLALAVVKDGRVVWAKGYGVRRLGDPAPVDARTLFGIASNTKVFTATALGLLVEEGKLAWDAPVVDYLPWFMMYDAYVTREITVRDLLVHRSGLGLGAGDLLWWPESTYDRRDVARRLRYIKPATSFRSAYAYDNVLYLVAGEVIQAVSGRTWEDFVAERILKRIGMTGSNVRHSAAGDAGNVAAPHARVEGAVRPVAPFTSDNTNPAGGINSGAEDMARWMLVRLNRGKLADGTALYSERTARQIETPVTIVPNPAPAAELAALRSNFSAYALGLGVRDYRGQRVLSHTGGLPGYVSQVTLLPERNLGIAVLTNAESTEAFAALTWQIIDHDLGAPPTDWTAAYLKLKARQDAETAAALGRSSSARNASSRPSLPLAGYAGTYTDAWYGDVVLAEENGHLVMRFTRTAALVGDLEHWQYDTFIARWRDRELRADAYVSFALDPDGSIGRIRMEAVSPETDFSYDFQDLDLRPAGKARR
ncbi:MAG TPA: serine hydrolase [Candidatus Aminicenantes bacterium]|nr:serine hydrolase [Candidatus Aminicenantes bacterium]HRY64819.1 serine hydrolase [Candidatus Aminicenantes bacterium]HRZ71732.1 serine hydrolase [Candidatus Aminicenantes bacterium]